MINDKSILAIIPARGGSKGLPGKNVRPLCGKPLIAWSIEAGLGSQYTDEVMVTTDSEEIAELALEHGAKVPFLRPSELAGDTATSFDVVKHVVDYYASKKQQFDYIVLLEPTSPLREANDVDGAIQKLLDHPDAVSIVGVCKTESQNPAFLVKIDDQGLLHSYLNKQMTSLRRQDISDVYYFEGSVYISKTEELLVRKSFYHELTIGYEFPKWKSLEIDDIVDFVMVEALMRHKGMCK